MHNFFKNNLKVTLWCSTNMIVLSKQAENQDPFKLINPSFLFSILWPICHSHPIRVSQSIQTMNYILGLVVQYVNYLSTLSNHSPNQC